MSTFLGLIEELPGVSVDRFDGHNLASSVFFLSHYHSDHVVGLQDSFFEMLQESNKYLYCSPISKKIIEGRFNLKNSSCIREIYVNDPIAVECQNGAGDSSFITVTCIPAGHSLGSVMFLFEKNDKTVLYTGDFRIHPNDFCKLKHLHYLEDIRMIPIKFDKIYLDTTFLCPEFSHLPTRHESLSKMHEMISSWLTQDPRNVVVLECSALYGSEFLYFELSKSLNQKIHVKDVVYNIYCYISELNCCVTNDPYSTCIHACTQKSSSLKCRDIPTENILTIIPSTLKWKGKNTSKVGEWDEVRARTFNVCYSMHSSFNELKAFIRYFNPKDIHPCVYPIDKTEKDVCLLLRELLGKPEDQIVSENKQHTLKFREDHIQQKVPFKSEYLSDDDSS